MTTFDIDITNSDGATRLALRGEFDIAYAPQLEREIRRFAEAGGNRLVIDLRGLSFIDSTGLRIVLEARQRAANSGFDLEIVRGPEQVQRVFELTGLEDHLPFVDEAS
jgi:anti-anti-sigma factor